LLREVLINTQASSSDGVSRSAVLHRVLTRSLIEVVGEEAFQEIKTAAGSESLFPLAEWYIAAVERFGANAAAGIFHRAGRGGFGLLLIQWGEEAGFSKNDFKLLPMQKKILTGLSLLGKVFTFADGQSVSAAGDEAYFYWRVNGSTGSGCRYYAGLLQEYMAWLGGGKVFWVEETACIHDGAEECVFRISKKPLD
jgi:hypothetical protein